MSIKGPDGEYEEVFVTVLAETDKAICVDHGGSYTEWLPKSQCEDWPDVCDSGMLMAKRWILEEKGII